MPKQIYKINNFEGGVNSKDDPRDLKPNELVSCKSMSVDSVGRVRMMGKAVMDNSVSQFDLTSNALKAGYGFFIFSHEYDMLENDNDLKENGEPAEVSTEYFVYQDDEHLVIFDSTNQVSIDAAGVSVNPNTEGDSTPAADFGDAGSGTAYARYYFANGALRVYDKERSSTFHTRWIGHIKRDLFGETSGTQSLNLWHSTTTKLMKPTTATYSETAGSEEPGGYMFSGDGTSHQVVNTVTTADKFKIDFRWNDHVTGTWIASTDYRFYLSYIYDGFQESPLSEPTGMAIATGVKNQSLFMGVHIDYYSGSAYNFNPRITGGRVYYSDPDEGHGTKYHLLDIDFVKGCKKFDENTWTNWSEETSDSVYECPAGIIATSTSDAFAAVANIFTFSDMPKSITYEMLNGYAPEEVTDAKFKCHTIFNNRAYIGNIIQDGITYNDRIIRSPINFEGNPQYDTFPATHKMDIAANDGDSIVALEGFGDRLLIFKEKSVYVINVAQDGAEFVENRFEGIGIKHYTQVTQTEFGIAWVNGQGCYLYSEGMPINLSEKISMQPNAHAPNMAWSGVSENKIPSIGYMVKEKKLLIVLGLVKNYSNDSWIYDFKTKSWTLAGGAFASYFNARSNFATSSDGKIYFSEQRSGKVDSYYWDDSPKDSSSGTGEVRMITPDIDFGHPGIRKKIYKVYLNFRSRTGAGNATNMQLYYQTNGNSDYSGTWKEGSFGIQSGASNFSELNEASTTAGANVTFPLGVESGGVNAAYAIVGGGTFTITHLTNIDTSSANAAQLSNGASGTAGYAVDTFTAENGISYVVNFDALVGHSSKSASGIRVIVSTSDAESDLNDGTGRLGIVTATETGSYSFVFKSTATTLYLAIDLNQDTTANRFNQISNLTTTRLSEWTTAILKPSTSVNNIYSFGLKFENDGVVNKDFEINDISIVYRLKNVK